MPSRNTTITKDAAGQFVGSTRQLSFAGEDTLSESPTSGELDYITKNVEPVAKIRPTTVVPDDRYPVTYPNLITTGLNRLSFGYWVRGNLSADAGPTGIGGIRNAILSQTLMDSKEYLKYGACFMVVIDYTLSAGEDLWDTFALPGTTTNINFINTANNITITDENALTIVRNTGQNFRDEGVFGFGYYANIGFIFPFSQYVKEGAQYGVGNISCADLLDQEELFNSDIFAPGGISSSLLGYGDLNDRFTAAPDPVEIKIADTTDPEIDADNIRFVRVEFWRTQGEDSE